MSLVRFPVAPQKERDAIAPLIFVRYLPFESPHSDQKRELSGSLFLSEWGYILFFAGIDEADYEGSYADGHNYGLSKHEEGLGPERKSYHC